jgi:predicted nucleic acid-binding protein
MKIAMLDTNVLLDIMYNEKKALEKLKNYADYTFVISFLVYTEIMAGSQIRVKADTRKFLQRFKVKEFDTKAHTIAKNSYINTLQAEKISQWIYSLLHMQNH